LIELLLVILVLGILAATVIFDLGNTTSSAASAACNSDAKTVKTAVMAFKYNPKNTGFVWPQASPAGNAQLLAPAASGYGGPFLSTWPSTSHYSIAIDANGNVLVNGLWYDNSPNPCSSVT
jgi:type II secretory pathway pseudopilin PulG